MVDTNTLLIIAVVVVIAVWKTWGMGAAGVTALALLYMDQNSKAVNMYRPPPLFLTSLPTDLTGKTEVRVRQSGGLGWRGGYPTPARWQTFLEEMKKNPNIKTVTFENAYLDEAGMRVLAEALNDDSNQTHTLELRGSIGREEVMEELGRMLTGNKSLKKLDLSRNRLANRNMEFLEPLVRGLNANNTLETLILNQNNFTREGLVPLADALSNRIMNGLNIEDDAPLPPIKAALPFMPRAP
mgnify:CR=1 FL=1